jgi:hypothetical protein
MWRGGRFDRWLETRSRGDERRRAAILGLGFGLLLTVVLLGSCLVVLLLLQLQ